MADHPIFHHKDHITYSSGFLPFFGQIAAAIPTIRPESRRARHMRTHATKKHPRSQPEPGMLGFSFVCSGDAAVCPPERIAACHSSAVAFMPTRTFSLSSSAMITSKLEPSSPLAHAMETTVPFTGASRSASSVTVTC